MTLIGIIDLLIAVISLMKPMKPVLLYAAFWAFATALMRPIAGGYILDFIERFANWAAPLALYFWVRYEEESPDSNHIPDRS